MARTMVLVAMLASVMADDTPRRAGGGNLIRSITDARVF